VAYDLSDSFRYDLSNLPAEPPDSFNFPYPSSQTMTAMPPPGALEAARPRFAPPRLPEPPAAQVSSLLGNSPYCTLVKNACIAECSETSLPSGNHGWRFYNCKNACMTRHGCDPFAFGR